MKTILVADNETKAKIENLKTIHTSFEHLSQEDKQLLLKAAKAGCVRWYSPRDGISFKVSSSTSGLCEDSLYYIDANAEVVVTDTSLFLTHDTAQYKELMWSVRKLDKAGLTENEIARILGISVVLIRQLLGLYYCIK